MTPESSPPPLIPTGEATALLPVEGGRLKPIRVIGTPAILGQLDEVCLQQAINARRAPGVSDLVLNPDAHRGYGAPVGCVLASPSHIDPGPVGGDIKCSMSLLQLELPSGEIDEPRVRRALIAEIAQRVPTGAGKGQRSVRKSRRVGPELGRELASEGATAGVCAALGIPAEWPARCEDWRHLGHDGTPGALRARLDELRAAGRCEKFAEK